MAEKTILTGAHIAKCFAPILRPSLIIREIPGLPAPATTALSKDDKFILVLWSRPQLERLLREEPTISLQDVVNHEIYHGIFGHIWIKDRKQYEPRKLNIACDCQVNSEIEVFQKDRFAHPGMYKLPLQQHWEEYYKSLPDQPEQPSYTCSMSEETVEAIQKEMDAFAEKHGLEIKKGTNPIRHTPQVLAANNYRGIRAAIDRLIGQDLSQTMDKRTSARRTHKWKDDGKGKIRGIGPKLCFAMDCSGSTTGEQVDKYFSLIRRLSKEYSATVIEFDDEIRSVGKAPSGKSWGGGTNFDKVVTYINTHKFDGSIWFTDGEAELSSKPHGKLVWVLSNTSRTDWCEQSGKVVPI